MEQRHAGDLGCSPGGGQKIYCASKKYFCKKNKENENPAFQNSDR